MLHADKDRLEGISQIPETMNLLILTPYVVARESVILQFDDLLDSCGIMRYASKDAEASPVISFGGRGPGERYELNNIFLAKSENA